MYVCIHQPLKKLKELIKSLCNAWLLRQVIFAQFLRGDDGNDALFGDDGNDTLDGGAGNDILAGESGADTYIISGGNDVIDDTGTGNGVTKDTISGLSGEAQYIEEGLYKLGGYNLVYSGGTLQIITGSGNVTVTGFSSGDYNITLQDAPEAPPVGDEPEDGIGDISKGEGATQPPIRVDPLTLDLNHNNQIDLISVNNSHASFDLTNEGLKHQVGWVGGNDITKLDANGNQVAGQDGIIDDANNNGTRLDDADGFLVLDSNNNNVVDNIDELFGSQDANGNITEGTDELATYDLGGNGGTITDPITGITTNVGAHDGKIDANDAIFNQLQIWQDFNQNGTTDAGELSTLTQHHITAINLATVASNQNVAGNVIVSTGSFEYTSTTGNDPITGLPITTTNNGALANLDLAINQTNSSSYTYQDASGNTVGYTLNLETLILPMSRGYGNTKAWHIAMSEDSVLLQEMKDMVNLTNGVNYQNLDSKIEQFIYQWTGTNNTTGMRGDFDAKKLAVLEQIRGVGYLDSQGNTNVQPWQVNFVQSAWDKIFTMVKDLSARNI